MKKASIHIYIAILITLGFTFFYTIHKVSAAWTYYNYSIPYTVACAPGYQWDGSACYIPPPTNFTASCNASGTSATMSWTAPAGYDTFYTRATLQGSTVAYAPGMDENFVGTSKTFATNPGDSYHVWIHTKIPTGQWSNQVDGYFSCPNPPPAPNLTITSTWDIPEGAKSGTTRYNSIYAEKWDAVPYATSCTLDGNPVPVSGGSNSGNTTDFINGTRTVTLSCTGPGGTATSSVTFYHPPWVTNETASCNASGTSATMSWTAPAGYNTFYTRTKTGGVEYWPGWDDNFVGTSKTFATTPGATYAWWIQAKAPNGSWGPYTERSFTCPYPVPTVTVNASPQSVGYNSASTITWSSTNATSCDQPSAGGPTSGSFNTGSLTATRTYTVYCNGPGGTSSGSTTVSVDGAPYGTLTPGAPSCEIPAGASSCTIPFSWTTGNPMSGYQSAVTTPVNQTVGTGNNNSGTFTVPYGAKTFYLYHAEYKLDEDSVSAYCTGGTSWNGSTCIPPAPTPYLTISGTWGISDGAQSGTTYYGAGYTVSWGNVANATACTLNGVGVATSGGTSSGSASGFTNNTRTFTLNCSGLGGSGSSSVTINYPPAPTGISGSCNASGTTGTFSWSAPSGYNTFYTRASTGGVNLGAPAWDDNFVGTTKTFTTTPGATYTSWVHSKASNGAWSDAPTASFTCANPAPIVTVTASPTSVGYNGASTITYSSQYATSCDRGGLSGSFSTGNLTSTTAFPVYCNGAGGTTGASATVTVDPPPTGSLTPSVTSCAIPAGTNSCAIPFTWSTSNPMSGYASAVTSWAGTEATGNSGSQSFSVGVGSKTFYLYHAGYLLDQDTVTADCTAGTGWNGTICVPPPTVTVSASPTSVDYGGYSTISWSSTNANSCDYGGTSGSSSRGPITANTTYTVYCNGPAGTSYGSVTVSVNSMSGTLTPSSSSCAIASGANSCAIPFTWNTSSPVGTSAVTSNGSTLATGNSGSQSFSVGYNSQTYYLYNNAQLLAQSTVSSYCTSGTAWSGSSCVPAPTVSVSASPSSIGYGSSSTITYSSTNATSCDQPSAGGPTSGSFSTGALYTSRTYDVYCNGPAGTSSGSVTVAVAPRPTGSMTPSSSSCAIALGASSCTIPFSWATYNPMSGYTSAITSSAGTEATGNSGSASLPVPYGSKTFYLYHAGIELDQDLVSARCTSGTAWNGSMCVPGPTINVTASPSSIAYNGSSTISWSSTNATSCSSAYGGGSGTSGSFNTGALTSSTTYTISCTGVAGTGSGSATVSVGAPPPSGSLNPSASSCTIPSGASTCAIPFTWSTTNPVGTSAVTSNGNTVATGNSGSQSFSVAYNSQTFYLYNNAQLLDQDTVYSSCIGGTAWNGSACVPGPTVSVTASPASVSYGGSSTVSWSSTNATSCSSAYGGGSGTSGSFNTGALTSSTTYTINCTGVAGSGSASTTVSVGAPPSPTVAVSASPSTIAYGSSSTISWSSTNATSCDQPSAGGPTSGSFSTGSLTTTTTYTVYCNGAGGTRSGSATVTVTPAPTGTLSTNSPCVIVAGSSTCNVNFTWTTTNPIGTSAITSPSFQGNVFTGNNGTNQPHAVPYGNSSYYLYNNSMQLAQAPATATCATGTAWNGTMCVAPPVVTVTATPQSINYGSTSTISWTSTNAATSCSSADYAGTGASGSFNTTSLTANREYVIYCSNVAGTSYGSVTVSVGGAPYGTLSTSAASCSIPSGGSTCSVNFSWTTGNPNGQSAVTTPVQITVFTGNTGTNQPHQTPYGATNYYLYNNGYQLDQTTVTGNCVSGTSWSGSSCEPIPPPAAAITYFQSGPNGSTCVANSTIMPQFTWTTNPVAATCQIVRGTDTQTGLLDSSQSSGGTLGGDGLYYKTTTLGVQGSSSAYTLQCSNNATIDCSNAGTTDCSATATVSICAIPSGFNLTADPIAQSPNNGQAIYRITATPTAGFSGTITLSAQQQTPALPTGSTTVYSPTQITCNSTSCTSTDLTVTIGGALTEESYPIQISGTGGSASDITMVYITLKKKPIFNEF